MYRIIVVDDEPAIVNGMVKLLGEIEAIELEIYKAYSAFQAIDIAKRVRIDVAVSDIRMPGMTGLEMYDSIINLWPSCKFVFLSGYSDFEYAYDTIHKHGTNYVLKTESDDIILKAVTDAVNKLKEEREQQVLVEFARKYMDELTPMLKKDLYETILMSDSCDSMNFAQRFDELGIKLSVEYPLMLVLGRIDRNDEVVSYSETLNMLYRVMELLSKSMSPAVIFDCSIVENSRLMIFIQPDAKSRKFFTDNSGPDWNGLSIQIKGTLETIQDVCRENFGFTVSFAISRTAVPWDTVSEEYGMIKAIANRSMVQGQQMIIDLGKPDEIIKVEQKQQMTEQVLFEQKLKEFENFLESGQDAEVDRVCRIMLDMVKRGFRDSYLISTERYYQILLILIAYINKHNLADHMEKDIYPSRLLSFGVPEDWNKEERFLVGLGRYLCMLGKKMAEDQNTMVISKLHKYIDANPGEDLSLTRLAEMVYFNPSYLSRFYKQVTGKTITEYINDVRIEEAKRILRDTNLKVNEIAIRLGYESASYFTTLFKKSEGMTPQEYRLNVMNETGN